MAETKVDSHIIDGVRPGTIQYFATDTVPAGWLECNGASAFSTTLYARLFAVVGYKYQATQSGTTFTIPDLRGQFIRSWAHGSALDPDRAGRTTRPDNSGNGDYVGTTQPHAHQGHSHRLYILTTGTANAGGNYAFPAYNGTPATTPADVTSIKEEIAYSTYGSPQISTESRPSNMNLMACIKY